MRAKLGVDRAGSSFPYIRRRDTNAQIEQKAHATDSRVPLDFGVVQERDKPSHVSIIQKPQSVTEL
jgi:hypothetical protein